MKSSCSANLTVITRAAPAVLARAGPVPNTPDTSATAPAAAVATARTPDRRAIRPKPSRAPGGPRPAVLHRCDPRGAEMVAASRAQVSALPGTMWRGPGGRTRMITVVDLSRSGPTAHNTVDDNQPAHVTTIVLRLTNWAAAGRPWRPTVRPNTPVHHGHRPTRPRRGPPARLVWRHRAGRGLIGARWPLGPARDQAKTCAGLLGRRPPPLGGERPAARGLGTVAAGQPLPGIGGGNVDELVDAPDPEQRLDLLGLGHREQDCPIGPWVNRRSSYRCPTRWTST